MMTPAGAEPGMRGEAGQPGPRDGHCVVFKAQPEPWVGEIGAHRHLDWEPEASLSLSALPRSQKLPAEPPWPSAPSTDVGARRPGAAAARGGQPLSASPRTPNFHLVSSFSPLTLLLSPFQK